MVLYSGGYGLSVFPSQYEPTALLGANQLSLEHRFFDFSWPASNDFTLLNIRQAAGDYHRIVQAFKPLYTRRWLTTGGSKGGMAAVYHRYFYPDDVDATVAYVAPNTHGLRDARFVRFLDQVGGEANTYGDWSLAYFTAYYYQSATELGWNLYPTKHLRRLLRYPHEDMPATYLPFPVEERFDYGLMLRVEHWVHHQGERMLFLYGDRDPWSAGPFEVRARNDSHRFYVPDANHTYARIARLPQAERSLALSRFYTWMDVTPPAVGAQGLAAESQTDVAPLVEERHRL